MEADPGKSHILLSSNMQRAVPFDNVQITSSLSEKLPGINFDLELKFEEHISKIYNTVDKKLNALHRIANHSRILNNKINRLHEKALRIVYSDFKANFDELLKKDGSFSIYHRNMQTFAIEILKFLNGLSPPLMNEMFQAKRSAPYYLRDKNEL